jgi:hypothetical protein
VTGLDFASGKVSFSARTNGVAGCNDKAYFQGPKELIDEEGEWALDPTHGMLYYWPYGGLLSGPIVAASSPHSLSFQGVNNGTEMPLMLPIHSSQSAQVGFHEFFTIRFWSLLCPRHHPITTSRITALMQAPQLCLFLLYILIKFAILNIS